jgi:hypothetical protein
MATAKRASKEGSAKSSRGGARPKESADDKRGGARPRAGRRKEPIPTQGLSCRAPKWLVEWIDAQPGLSRGMKTLELLLEAARARGATPPQGA